jgi:hypothetical protein
VDEYAAFRGSFTPGRGKDHFELKLMPGSQDHASGKVPFPNGTGVVTIDWRLRNRDGTIVYHVKTPKPIWIHHAGSDTPVMVDGEKEFTMSLDRFEWKL